MFNSRNYRWTHLHGYQGPFLATLRRDPEGIHSKDIQYRESVCRRAMRWIGCVLTRSSSKDAPDPSDFDTSDPSDFDTSKMYQNTNMFRGFSQTVTEFQLFFHSWTYEIIKKNARDVNQNDLISQFARHLVQFLSVGKNVCHRTCLKDRFKHNICSRNVNPCYASFFANGDTPVDLRQVQAVLELLGELLEQRAELEGVDLARPRNTAKIL